ncbi:carbohydrate sulfotransferase 15-like [Pomacea canaliculata]|uniref:carbohydrate sulfotransferase 15-like n=1 Tax=Pomacea canaliculata TaxID=400727 RepID=UPI000D726DEE|nr:carbohydrate sulfotransferase 15-like [Pomacea canaliculata]
MPPIEFLPNYKAPCWYENLPLGDQIPGTPYTRNLFTCFSPNARTLFLEMHAEWAVSTQLASNPKRLRCLPYFYIAGMPKCGSTDLYRKVTQHPEVVRPPMKESHWWSKNRFGVRLNYSSLIPLDQYVDLFDKAALRIESHAVEVTSTRKRSSLVPTNLTIPWSQALNKCDGSASTLWDNDDWWRLPENCGRDEPLYTNANYIRHLTPHARVLVILRQPTDRLFSDYLYFQKTNKSLAEFHEHVVLSVSKLKSCMEQLSLRACVYDKRIASGVKVRLRVGIYHVYLAEWLKVFPRDQILVIRLEDYAKNLKQTTRRVYDFLGLRKLSREEEDKILQSPIANARKKKDKDLGFMWEDTHRLLRDFYQPHNEKLADLLGDPRFLWTDVHSPTNGSTDHPAGADNHTESVRAKTITWRRAVRSSSTL